MGAARDGQGDDGFGPTMDSDARAGAGADDERASGGTLTADSLATGETAASGGGASLASSGTLLPGQASARELPEDPAALRVVPFDTYVRLEEFARGGLGRIVRARDERTGRIVAIKEMLRSSADASARFVREALITANLQHPGIVPVYEVGCWPDGQAFYAMKLVAGRPLSAVIDEVTHLDARLALIGHVIAVADALAYAHENRIIHRDLKPLNVLCGSLGETVVIDWGLARRLGDRDHPSLPPVGHAAPGQTVVGAVMGTPAFMAPEQARGEPVDERVDVYAIGAMLYHLLAGRSPFQGRTVDELLDQVRSAAPRPLVEVVPGVPRDLAAIVTRAMARAACDRYPSAAELARDLRRFATGQLVAAHHYSTAERARRFATRYRLPLGITAIATLALAIGGTVAVRNVVAARRAAEDRRVEAQQRLAGAHADRARVELETGHADQALALAAAALELGASTPALHHTAARAAERLPEVRRRATPTLESMVFVPGTDDLVVVSEAGIERWSPAKDAVIWTAPGEGGNAFLLDARQVLVQRPTALEILDLATGASIARMGFQAGVEAASPLGADAARRWAAVSTADGFLELFDLRSQTRVARIPHAPSETAPAISADGERIVLTTYVDGSHQKRHIELLARSGRVLAELCPQGSLSAVHPGGVAVAYAAAGGLPTRVRLFDWQGRAVRELATGSSAEVLSLTSDPSRGMLEVGFSDGVVDLYELATGVRLWRRSRDGAAFEALFDARGRLWTLGIQGGLIVHDAVTGIELAHWQPGGHTIRLSADSRHVAVGRAGQQIAVWNVDALPTFTVAPSPARVRRVAFTASGDVISGSEDGRVTRFDGSGAAHAIGAHGARVTSLQVLADGAILSAGRDDMTVLRDAATGRELQRLNGSGVLAHASPDGRWIATGGDPGAVTIWDRATGARVRTLGTLGASLARIRWSPDGRRVAAIDDFGEVSVWERDGKLVRSLPKGTGAVSVVFSPDGRWLVRCARNERMLYALDGGKDVTLEGAAVPNMFVDADFSMDGRRVAVVGAGFAQIWDTSGRAVSSMPADRNLTSVRFSRDGHLLFTGGQDQRLRTWDVATGVSLDTLTTPSDIYGLELDPTGERLAVMTLGSALVTRVAVPSGALSAEAVRCRSGLEMAGGVLRAAAVDLATCNRH